MASVRIGMLAVSYLNDTFTIFITVLTRLRMPSSGPGSGKFKGSMLLIAGSFGGSSTCADCQRRLAREALRGRVPLSRHPPH